MSVYINKKNIIRALKKSGVKKNDVLFLHSDISKLGKLEGSLKQQLKTYLNSIINLVGYNGTIAVPAFYFEYSKKKYSFNTSLSPVSREIGLFSNFFCKQKNVKRSLNPLRSVAAIGKNAKYICGGNTATSYGVDSPFDRLTKLKAKIVLVGAENLSYVHYVEYMVGVPHIYSKLFETPIYRKNKKINLPISSQVNYLDHNVIYPAAKDVLRKFEKAGLVRKSKLGKGFIKVLLVEKVFDFLKKNLQKNFFYLLKTKPKFKKGKIPLI